MMRNSRWNLVGRLGVLLLSGLAAQACDANTAGDVDAGADSALADGTPEAPDAAPAACIAKVATGGHHTCVLKGDGSLWCWGANGTAQLNDLTQVDDPTPRQLFAEGIAAVASGAQHSCALDTEGRFSCWGRDANGQIGNGLNYYSMLAFEVFSEGVQEIGIGPSSNHTCVRKGDRTVWCWGSNVHGQVGNASEEDAWLPVSVLDSAGGPPVLGGNFTCAHDDAGATLCWGANHFGQLGRQGASSTVPAPAVEGEFVELSAGGTTTCGIKADRSLWCWGDGIHGQLGDGSKGNSAAPVRVFEGEAGDVAEVSVAGNYVCARRADSSLWCWGKNNFGQLGDGTIENRLLPVMTFASGVTQVSTGISHACAAREDDTVWCWGFNRYGQLGQGTTPADPFEPTTVPVPVALDCTD